MLKTFVAITFGLLLIPAYVLADAADTDYDDDTSPASDCTDFCYQVAPCETACITGDCLTYCQENYSKLSCLSLANCSAFNECVCGATDDDSPVSGNDDETGSDDEADDDNEADDDQAENADASDSSDDDNDNNHGCSISTSQSGAMLTLFMLVIGMTAFLFSLKTGSKTN